MSEENYKQSEILPFVNENKIPIGKGVIKNGLLITNHISGFPYARIIEKIDQSDFYSNLYFLIRPGFPFDEVHIICHKDEFRHNNLDKRIINDVTQNDNITIGQIYNLLLSEIKNQEFEFNFRSDSIVIAQFTNSIQLEQGDSIIIPPYKTQDKSHILIHQPYPIIVNGYEGQNLVVSDFPESHRILFWGERFIYPDYYYGAYSDSMERKAHKKIQRLIRFTK